MAKQNLNPMLPMKPTGAPVRHAGGVDMTKSSHPGGGFHKNGPGAYAGGPVTGLAIKGGTPPPNGPAITAPLAMGMP